MKLNFNIPMLNLDGKPTEDTAGDQVQIGKILASELSQAREGDAVKFWDWALKLHRGETLDLDRSDQSTLKEFVKQSKGMAMLKAQLLDVFEKSEAKESKKNTEKP